MAANGTSYQADNDRNVDLTARLYSVLNSGDCDSATERCTEDWYLAVGIPIAGGGAAVYFLGSLGGVFDPTWTATAPTTASVLRLTIQEAAVGVMPGTPGPASSRRRVDLSVGVDTLFVLPVPALPPN
jgi:hypothetical protein